MKTRFLTVAAGRRSAMKAILPLLYAVCSVLIAARSSPANATVMTFTDSATYFADAGHQVLQDFNSPISSTATSVTYHDLVVSCSGGASVFCDSLSFGTTSSVSVDGIEQRHVLLT